jgi:hypothetical protein
VWVAAALVASGCTANFFVGEMTETDDSGGGSTGMLTTSAASSLSSTDPSSPSSSGGMSTSSTTGTGEVETVTETTDPTTTTETTMSVSATVTTTESASSSSSAEGPTTTGPMGCAEFMDMTACDGAAPECIWEGRECIENPCPELNGCTEHENAAACEDDMECFWLPEGEMMGTCFLNHCVPCNEILILEQKLCQATENCVWNLETCDPLG